MQKPNLRVHVPHTQHSVQNICGQLRKLPNQIKMTSTEKLSFLFRNKDKGVCGAWSFDALTETCQLFNVDACCGQLDKQENAASFISGYACPHCWSTHNECPCGLARRQACPTCSLHSAGAGKPTLTSPTVSYLQLSVITVTNGPVAQ